MVAASEMDNRAFRHPGHPGQYPGLRNLSKKNWLMGES